MPTAVLSAPPHDFARLFVEDGWQLDYKHSYVTLYYTLRAFVEA
jgi:hypothetical protein